jgi:hypothetical protein
MVKSKINLLYLMIMLVAFIVILQIHLMGAEPIKGTDETIDLRADRNNAVLIDGSRVIASYYPAIVSLRDDDEYARIKDLIPTLEESLEPQKVLLPVENVSALEEMGIDFSIYKPYDQHRDYLNMPGEGCDNIKIDDRNSRWWYCQHDEPYYSWDWSGGDVRESYKCSNSGGIMLGTGYHMTGWADWGCYFLPDYVTYFNELEFWFYGKEEGQYGEPKFIVWNWQTNAYDALAQNVPTPNWGWYGISIDPTFGKYVSSSGNAVYCGLYAGTFNAVHACTTEIWANIDDGYLACETSPSGADIWIDSVLQLYQTPKTFYGKPGTKEVKYTKSGYYDCVNSYDLISGQTTTAYCSLTPVGGPSNPVCEITPSSHSLIFPDTDVGDYSTKTFKIKNIGGGTLSGSVSESSPDFHISPTSGYSLGAGNSKTYTVFFEPTSGGEKSTTINTDSPCNNVNCSGTGIEGMTQLEVGELVFYADQIEQESSQQYTLTGNVNINNVLYFTGTITVDKSLTHPGVYGNCSIYIPDVDFLGTVNLFDGEFDIHVDAKDLLGFLGLDNYSNFTVGGFGIELKGLELLSDGVMISCSIKFPKDIGSVDFDKLQVTKSGGIELAGELHLPNFNVAGIGFEEAYLTFDTENDEFGGGIKVKTPLVTIGGSVSFWHGMLNKVYLTVGLHPGIALDATGLFLVEGTGGLDHISDGQPLLISITIDITGGPSVNGVAVVKFNDVGVEIQYPTYFHAGGGMQVFNQDVARGDVVWTNETLSLDGYVSLAAIFDATFGATLTEDYFNGNIEGRLHTPDEFPWYLFWLSWAAGIDIGYAAADICNEYMRGMVNVYLLEMEWNLAFKFTFGNPDFPWFHFAIGTNYNNLVQLFKRYYGLDYAETFLVGEGAERALFIIKTETGPLPYYYLINPVNDTLDEQDLTFIDFPTEGYAFYVVNDPMPGQWDIYVPNGKDKTFELYAKGPNLVPAIRIIRPAVPGNENLIEWEADDLDDNADIRFYFDNDNSGFNGILINDQAIKEDSRVESLVWDNSNVEPGEYYIYAVIEDSLNAPMRVYSRGTIIVENPDLPDAPTGFQGQVVDSTAVLTWDLIPEYSVYVVYCRDTLKDDSEPMPYAVDTNESIIYDLTFGYVYEFQVAAVDSLDNVGNLSDPVVLELYSSQINSSPTITSIDPPLTAIENILYTFALSAVDLDGDQVNFELAENPDGMELLGEVINWIPDSSQVGVNYVKIYALDALGGIDSLEFYVHVFNIQSTIPSLKLNCNIYRGREATGYVMLNYFDISSSTSIIDTAIVQLHSNSDPAGLLLRCVETATFSNSYAGQFSFNMNGSLELDVKPGIWVSSGDSIFVEYQIPDDTVVYSDEAVWFAVPLDCNDLNTHVYPEKWPETWWHGTDFNESYPTFEIRIRNDEHIKDMLSNIDFGSIRLNLLIAPEDILVYPLAEQNINGIIDSAILVFDVQLALHIMEAYVPGIYPLYLTGHSKNGETFCSQSEVMLVESQVGKEPRGKSVPETYKLDQNYPNPFNPNTQISFSLPELAKVKLEIFNVSGQIITTLKDGALEAGTYNVFWNGKDKDGNEVAGGIYFYRLKTDMFTETKKMLLLK